MAARDEKVMPTQKELLVNFMESNLEFARGKLLRVEGRLQANSLWEMLEQQLNGIGPEKSVEKWLRDWTQLKIKIKRKSSSMSESRGRTGGGPPTETPLTDLEEKVIFIISREGVFGLQGPDGVALESGQLSADICIPSTSANVGVPILWVAMTEESQAVETDINSLFSAEASTRQKSQEVMSCQCPRTLHQNLKKMKKVSVALESVMEQTDTTNTQIANLTNEMYEVRGVLNNLLEEHRNTNAILERIVCTLENKK